MCISASFDSHYNSGRFERLWEDFFVWITEMRKYNLREKKKQKLDTNSFVRKLRRVGGVHAQPFVPPPPTPPLLVPLGRHFKAMESSGESAILWQPVLCPSREKERERELLEHQRCRLLCGLKIVE